MAATDHLQGKLFMTARELLQDYRSADVDPSHPAGWKSHDQMWTSKRKDNAADGLAADVAKRGVEYPVTLGIHEGGEQKIVSGHHRIMAAYTANPRSYVPVQYRDYTKRSTPEPQQPVTTNRFPSFP
jgi:hypothetical protein